MKIVQGMMPIDGKLRTTDTLDTKGILRLIESVPSQNDKYLQKVWKTDKE